MLVANSIIWPLKYSLLYTVLAIILSFTYTKRLPPNQSDQAAFAEVNNAVEYVHDFLNYKICTNSIENHYTKDFFCGGATIDSSRKISGKRHYTIDFGNETLCGLKHHSGQISIVLTKGKKLWSD